MVDIRLDYAADFILRWRHRITEGAGEMGQKHGQLILLPVLMFVYDICSHQYASLVLVPSVEVPSTNQSLAAVAWDNSYVASCNSPPWSILPRTLSM